MNAILALMICNVLHIYDTVRSIVLLFVPRRFRKRKDITGKKVLITGAGSGVGRQLAVEFSKYSTCLILVDINRESLLETEKLLEGRSSVFVYGCDVSDYKKVYEMAKQVQRDAGDVDILVNNAGILSDQYLADLPEEKIIKTMEVNALAHFWTCKAFLPAMMDKNEGHIVSIASMAGKMGGARLTDYSSSKFAAVGFAESLEIELRAKQLNGIKVTIVCPSLIDTGLFKGAKPTSKGILTPEYVAQEILTGVLEDQDIIYLPHYLKYIFMYRGIVSRWVNIKTLELTGNLRAMDKFMGRTQKANVTQTRNNPGKTD